MGQNDLESLGSKLLQLWQTKFLLLERAGGDPDLTGLSDEEKRFWLAIQMHPDAREVLRQVSEFPSSHWASRFESEGKGNPLLHVTLHAAVKGTAQEDPDWRAASGSLLEQARGHQSDEESSQHAAEHVLTMIFLQGMQTAASEDPPAASRQVQDWLRRCRKWKKVPKPLVEQIQNQVTHNY